MCWMTPGKPFNCHCISLMLFKKKILVCVLESKKTLNIRWSHIIWFGLRNMHDKLMFLKLGCWVLFFFKKKSKTKQLWFWSVDKGDLKLPYIDCDNIVLKNGGETISVACLAFCHRCKVALYYHTFTTRHYPLEGWPCTPFTSTKSRWSVVLFHVCHGSIYAFSETVMRKKYFAFTSSQQETLSHIVLGCLMEILSFAVFPIDAEVVDLYWKSLWDSCWAISVFCTPKFCSWCWQFHSSSRIELSSREVEITQHEMVPHLKDTEGEFWTWRTHNLT